MVDLQPLRAGVPSWLPCVLAQSSEKPLRVTLQTGARGKEPLRTLAKYRLEDGKVWFGMNLIHDHPGNLSVGDSVLITASGARP